MRGLLARVIEMQQAQLVDSQLATTREHWRLAAGATPEEAADPRPFAEVLSERENG